MIVSLSLKMLFLQLSQNICLSFIGLSFEKQGMCILNIKLNIKQRVIVYTFLKIYILKKTHSSKKMQFNEKKRCAF